MPNIDYQKVAENLFELMLDNIPASADHYSRFAFKNPDGSIMNAQRDRFIRALAIGMKEDSLDADDIQCIAYNIKHNYFDHYSPTTSTVLSLKDFGKKHKSENQRRFEAFMEEQKRLSEE